MEDRQIETITIITEDGQAIQVDRQCINQMGALSSLLGLSSKPPPSLSIPNVKSTVLVKILEYLNYHLEDSLIKVPSRSTKQTKESVITNQEPLQHENNSDDNLDVASQSNQQYHHRHQDDSDVADDDDNNNNNDDTDFSSSSSTPDDEYLYEEYIAAVAPWDQRFMDALDLQTLLEMTKAVNYLNIPRLLDLCCRTIAKHMTGLTAEELRKKFNLPHDLTPEQEAKLASEFAWIDE